MTKKRKRIKVVKVTPNVEPQVHEVLLHVEALESPPPLDEECEFHEPIASTTKKRGFWAWLLGA